MSLIGYEPERPEDARFPKFMVQHWDLPATTWSHKETEPVVIPGMRYRGISASMFWPRVRAVYELHGKQEETFCSMSIGTEFGDC